MVPDATPIAQLPYAGFWRRFGAAFVDMAIFGFVYLVLVTTVIVWAMGGSIIGWAAVAIICSLLYVTAGPLYYGIQESGRHRATFGKRLFCIKVQRPNQQPLGFWRATARHLAHWPSAVLWMAGYLMQPFTAKRQALHDMFTDSVVVKSSGSAVRNTARLLLYASGALVGMVCATLLSWAAINWVDEPLRPEVQQALNWKPSANALVDNGYLILIGKGAPTGSDPHAAGKAIALTHLQQFAAKRPAAQWAAEYAQRQKPIDGLVKLRCDYQSQGQGCVQHYLNTRPAMESALVNAAVDAERFLAILRSRNFEEIELPVPDAPLPDWMYMLNSAELFKVRALYEIADGETSTGMSHLLESVQFSRRMLQKTSSLVGRMYAVAMVERDMRFISDLMRKYPSLVQTHSSELLRTCAPISGTEFGFLRLMEFQRDTQLNNYENLADSAGNNVTRLLARIFYQPGATMNAYVSKFEPLLLLADSPAGSLSAVSAEIAAQQPTDLGYGLFGLIYLKNPIGKLVLSNKEIDYKQYLERQHDADGYVRLVALQVKLAKEGVEKKKIGDALKNTGEEFRDPYTHLAMRWDAATSRISFQGRQPSNHNVNKSSLFAITVQ